MDLLKLQKMLYPLLAPLGAGYAALMSARRSAYKNGLFSAYQPGHPTISVGNISWGGTGKTPLTEWLLDWAAQKCLNAVILTRGYKGKPGDIPVLVKPDMPPEITGDEPLMLAGHHPEAKVLVHPQRRKSAEFAETGLSPDLFILDDGMQHLGVRRDIDIVLLRPEDLSSQWNKVIPAGSWREGKRALSAASCFCIKAGPDEFRLLETPTRNRLEGFGVPLFSFTLTPKGLFELGIQSDNSETTAYVDFDKKRPYILTSGVGNPCQVQKTVTLFMGREPERHIVYPDHHAYCEDDILNLSAQDLPVICTAKDAVKLAPLLYHRERVHTPAFFALDTAIEFGPALFTDRTFPQWWDERWARLGTGA